MLNEDTDFFSINLWILSHAVLVSAIPTRHSSIKIVTKNLILAKTESNVNTLNDVKECSVRISVVTEMNPATAWLVKNNA